MDTGVAPPLTLGCSPCHSSWLLVTSGSVLDRTDDPEALCVHAEPVGYPFGIRTRRAGPSRIACHAGHSRSWRATVKPVPATPSFAVRPAGPDDDATVAQLVRAYVAEANPLLVALAGRTIVPADEALARRWVTSSRAEGALVLLVVRGESALGTGTLRQLDPGISEVKRMYVRPEARGSGIGGALLDTLVAEARARGSSAVRLDSAPFQLQAHVLYRSRGFVEREPYPGSETPAGLLAAWHFFELRLTPDAAR